MLRRLNFILCTKQHFLKDDLWINVFFVKILYRFSCNENKLFFHETDISILSSSMNHYYYNFPYEIYQK